MNKKICLLTAILIILLLSAGCAAGNERWDFSNRAGFFAGLWHGFIIVVAFIISLFTENVGIYEIHNAGWTYDLGFLLGLCFSLMAPWKVGCSRD